MLLLIVDVGIFIALDMLLLHKQCHNGASLKHEAIIFDQMMQNEVEENNESRMHIDYWYDYHHDSLPSSKDNNIIMSPLLTTPLT